MAELSSIFNDYKRGTMSKDALLEFVKSQIEQNPIGADYNRICKHFKDLRILFFSTSDLEFLSFFNKMIKIHFNMKQALLGEDIDEYNCKAEFTEPGQMHFDFNQMETYSKKFHYLVHSVHDTERLPNILGKYKSGIRLRGNSNKDYNGVSLVWFGTKNENATSKNSSRYGSISFKIKIYKVLAKGRNYFAMGTRIYTRERSHSILITDREQIRIQTQLKKTNYDKKTHKKKNVFSKFEHDFPRIVNIQENELCKKENNEWFLNDGLDLDDSSSDWDHPEFCLEANEESNDADNDNNVYAYFDFDDFKICFLEHGGEDNLCVKKKGKKTGCPLTREKSMREFIELVKSRKIPSLLKLRKCFDETTFKKLFQLQFGDDLLELCIFELNVKKTDNLNNIQARFNEFKKDLNHILKKLKRLNIRFDSDRK
jgi:hypothetical protein